LFLDFFGLKDFFELSFDIMNYVASVGGDFALEI
jgi:hypothetical protein